MVRTAAFDWLTKFRNEDTDLDDQPESGRPREIDRKSSDEPFIYYESTRATLTDCFVEDTLAHSKPKLHAQEIMF
ncbi:hypothetical protein KIN20_027345 [Parelaphostrongylus tenuis]|uniref:Uncharacterized protein n=1 Tax=Parelaphostrongylus tenuis TaxID=148309 RepID=A0AAD5QZF3_PARTN|nr:hypothetical protein KIN20_027345 [Parelaphostrongylus tenuis]